MKYVWLVMLLIGLSWTWAMGGAERDARMAMMTDRQFELADIITKSIEEKRPDVTGVNFSQLYTEIINPDHEMMAHYRYEITSKQNEETSTEVIEGSSKLVSENGTDWTVVSSNIRQPTVGFQKGMTVSRNKDADAAQNAASAAEPSSQQEVQPAAQEEAPAPEHSETH